MHVFTLGFYIIDVRRLELLFFALFACKYREFSDGLQRCLTAQDNLTMKTSSENLKCNSQSISHS